MVSLFFDVAVMYHFVTVLENLTQNLRLSQWWRFKSRLRIP